VQGTPGTDAWVIRAVLLAEVDALLLVRTARRELPAHREPAAPREPGSRHRDGRLPLVGEREELTRRLVELTPQLRVDAVAADDEEPEVAARLVDRLGDGAHLGVSACAAKRGDVDEGHVHAATVPLERGRSAVLVAKLGSDPGVDSFEDVTELLDYPMVVVTTASNGRSAGCLAGFATQISIDPPRYLVGLSDKNHTHRVALDAERLVVHLLDNASMDVAHLFGEQTGDDVDKFAACEWHAGPDGVPVLVDAPAWFSGTVHDRRPAGDHTAFVLDVDAAEVRRRPGRLLRLSDVADFEPGHDA